MVEKKKEVKPVLKNTGSLKDDDNISTIREILFGNKITQFEKRFEELEKHLNQEMSALRQEVERLYKNLEGFIKSEQKSLLDSFKAEQKERLETDRRIREDLEALAKKLAGHKEETADAQRDLRQLLLDRHKELADEIQHLKKELHSTLEARTAALEEKKVSRFDLADLLTEMALKLGLESPGTPGEQK
jgi:seryl-tRNA synthetase